MLIILEGLDLSGKSYIAEQLLKQLPDCYYIKHGNRPVDSSIDGIIKIQETYSNMLHMWRSIATSYRNMIFDRFFPSEMVYSQVKRGYDAFHDPFYEHIQDMLIAADYRVLIVYIHTHKEELVKRFELRGDDYMDLDDIDKLLARYNVFLASTRLPVCHIQSGTPIDTIMEKINK